MDTNRPKKQSRGRKRRLQLDENESESYSKHYASDKNSNPSASSKIQTPKTSSATTSRRKQNSSTVTKVPRSTKSSKSKTQVSGSSDSSSNVKQTISSTAVTPTRLEGDESNNVSNGTPQRAGTSSPEPNCAICLGQMENKSFTDSCFHQFCFVCLLEWSKVKAECPLCKQSFKSIVHNVRSYNDYDQYELPRPENQLPLYNFIPHGGVRFRYRTTVTDHRYAHIADQINQEIESRLLQRPSRALPIPNYRRLRQPANSDFRRSVYLQRLRLTSQHSETRRRVRETSPTFFQNNPAQTHRLVPWVNRELNALLHGHGEQVAFVLDLIMGLIKRYPIDSEEFYQHMFPYIGRHTRQFMREFMMFAKSPYHMAAYDRHISYEPNNEPRHDSDSESDQRAADNGNDSDVIVLSPGNSPVGDRNPSPPPPHGGDQFSDNTVLRRNWTADSRLFQGFNPLSRAYASDDIPSMNPYAGLGSHNAPPAASGWDSPTPGPSHWPIPGYLASLGLDIPSTSRSEVTLSHNFRSDGSLWKTSQSYIDPLAPPLSSTSSFFSSVNLFPRQSSPINIMQPSTSQNSHIQFDDTDSDSSDIEIVNVEKPWTERSPIHLSSGGDTDYDVMITGMTHVNDPVKTEKKKKKKKHKRNSTEDTSEKRSDSQRSTDSHRERHSKKRHHRSRSKSLPKSYRGQSRSRTRSVSPIRLSVLRSQEYQHKKFGYRSGGESFGIGHHRQLHRSRFPSTSDTDTESHLSITSHRHSSSSKHSHVEILEYRKKSSKSKKKKHKHSKSKESSSGFDQVEKKHKKSKKTSRSADGEIESVEKLKPHSKHKSKKKSHHKNKKKASKKDKQSEIDYVDLVPENDKEKTSIYTSDSDPDSDTDAYANDEVSLDENNKQENRTSRVQSCPSGLEFVEVDAAQAAILDEELDSISKKLNTNDYISSLLAGSSQGQSHAANQFKNDSGRTNTDVFSQKPFKKHPFGHKKSNKKSQSMMNSTSSLSSTATATTEAVEEPQQARTDSENFIQSNDVSSCSDIDFERQLPSFLTFSSAHNLGRRLSNIRNLFNIGSWNSEPLTKPTATKPSYESPTSTAAYLDKDSDLHVVDRQTEGDLVDVETLSEESDIDVAGESAVHESALLSLYRNDNLNIPTRNASKYMDVSGDSDNETNNLASDFVVPAENDVVNVRRRSMSNGLTDNDSSYKIDVENDDSDIECSLIEGHKTFEIGEDSDSDINVEEINEDVCLAGNNISLIRCSEDEIIIDDAENEKQQSKNKSPKEVTLDLGSDTDLDYSYEDDKACTADMHHKKPEGQNDAKSAVGKEVKPSVDNSENISEDQTDNPPEHIMSQEPCMSEEVLNMTEGSVDGIIEPANPNKDNFTSRQASSDSPFQNSLALNTPLSNSEVTFSASGSGFIWAPNSLYHARRLSESELGNANSPPDPHLMVAMSRERTSENEDSASQNSLTSPDTEETFSSFEVLDRPYSPDIHEGEFQAED